MPTDPLPQAEQPKVTPQFEPGEIVTFEDLVRPEIFKTATKSIKQKIVLEQSYTLATTIRRSTFYTLFMSTLSLSVFWPATPHPLLFAWYGILLAATLGRHWTCVQFAKVRPSGPQLAVWLRRIWIASCLPGMVWCGLLALVWSVGQIGIVVFAGCMLASLAFASYASLGQFPKIYLSAAIAEILALIILFIHIADGFSLASIVCIFLLLTAGMISSSATSRDGWRSILTFMHQHQNLARQYREESTVLSTILQSIGDGVITFDRNGLITYLNPAAERMTGLECRDVVGKTATDGFTLTNDADAGQQVDLALVFKQLNEAMKLPGELVLSCSDMPAVSVEVTISPLLYAPGKEIDGYIVTLHDVTLQRLSARELTRQALHDPLTGLINRRGFERRLHDALQRQSCNAGQNSICFIDLDRFKLVNDTCGHQAGDALLKQVTATMQAKMRDSDVFARLGGDEFAVLLNGCAIENALKIADTLCRAVADLRFDWEGRQFTIGASIGVAPMVAGDTAQTITEAADDACYRAKESGRGRVCVALRQLAA